MHPYEFKIKYSQNIKVKTEQNVRSYGFYTRFFFTDAKNAIDSMQSFR